MKRTIIALGLMWAVGCGSSAGGGGPSGVDGSKQVSSVTASEKEQLCDWFVAMVGGYGAVPTCDTAPIDAPPSKAECTADFPSCAVSVSVLETCITALVAAGKTCTEAATAQAIAKPECQMAAPCFE